jgi:hypothetical protein
MNAEEMAVVEKVPFKLPNMAAQIEDHIGRLMLASILAERVPKKSRLVATGKTVAARRQRMFEFIDENGASQASEVSETIGGHPSNVHTDLVFMFKQGQLCRVRTVSKFNRTCHAYWVNPDWVEPEDFTASEE